MHPPSLEVSQQNLKNHPHYMLILNGDQFQNVILKNPKQDTQNPEAL